MIALAAGTRSALAQDAAVSGVVVAERSLRPVAGALVLEGQHLGDIIRYGVPLTPAAGAPYPGGGVYGSQRCLPLPDVERDNNPALRG